MADFGNIIAHLNTAIKKDREGDVANALKAFSEFLEAFKGIGVYTHEAWPISFTKQVWGGVENINKENISIYLAEAKKSLVDASISEAEPLEFVISELEWNAVEKKEDLKGKYERLVSEYPCNLEFKHSLAHIFAHSSDGVDKAIELYKECIRVWGDAHYELITKLYNLEMGVASELLRNGKFDEAAKVSEKMNSNKLYYKDAHLTNATAMLYDRIKDAKAFYEKLLETENKTIERIGKEVDEQRRRSFEMLGLFSAIIAFILTTATTVVNIDVEYIIPVLSVVGLMLIFFVVTVSYVTSIPRKPFTDVRTYVLFLYAVMSCAAVYVSLLGINDDSEIKGVVTINGQTPIVNEKKK